MSATLTRPVALPVKPENLPAELTERNQFVMWRYVPRDDKWTKVPVNPANGKNASSTDPATWGTFEAALAGQEWYRCDGVGFMFAESDSYYFIDLDNCFDLDILLPWAAAIVAQLPGCYWEQSVSGGGQHGIGRGSPPTWRKKNGVIPGVEIYLAERFATLTGHIWDLHSEIGPDSTPAITAVHRKVFGPEPDMPPDRQKSRQNGVSPEYDLDIIASLKGMANGERFARLMRGDTSGYGSGSEADAALLARVLWRNGGDIEQAVRIASDSGLWRPKWESRRGDSTYIEYTAERILARIRDFYDPYHGRPVRTWIGTLPGGELARFVSVKVRG